MSQRRQLPGARHVLVSRWVGRLRLQHASVQVQMTNPRNGNGESVALRIVVQERECVDTMCH